MPTPDEPCFRCCGPGPLTRAFDLQGLVTYVCNECLDTFFDDDQNELRTTPKPPYILRQGEDLKAYPPWPFPSWDGISEQDNVHLENRQLVARLFCDSSGFGSDHEPALTLEQLRRKLNVLLESHGDLALAVTEVGMFQVWVGAWTLATSWEAH